MPTNVLLGGCGIENLVGQTLTPSRKLESPTTLESPNPKFSRYTDHDVEKEIRQLKRLPRRPSDLLLPLAKSLAELEKEMLFRGLIKERTDCGERLSKRQKTDCLASSGDVVVLNPFKGKVPLTHSSPNNHVSSSTPSGRLAGPPPRPGLQSSLERCRLCTGSNSDSACSSCRGKVMVKKIEDIFREQEIQQQEKEEVLQHKEDLLKENEKLLQQALQRIEALKKEVEDAVREIQTLKQKLQENDYRRECLVCLVEFGDDPSRQRAHYSDCNHANTCFGCAMKLWNRGNSNCPCCNTPGTLFPLRLPAKIFL